MKLAITQRVASLSVAVFAVAAGLAPTDARAQSSLDARYHMDPTQKHAAAVPLGSANHRLYGRIGALRGNLFVLLLRDGKTVNVDAGEAVKTGRYSAPLFVGKYVVVTGPSDVSNVVHADSVTRLQRLDDMTFKDR
jgi:hypothetical protein